MTEKKPYSFNLRARPKDSSPATIAAVDASGERAGFNVRDPEPEKAPAKRGRPKKDRTATEARPSFGLDPETHRKFKIWLLRNGVSMQDYLEAHIRDLVKDE